MRKIRGGGSAKSTGARTSVVTDKGANRRGFERCRFKGVVCGGLVAMAGFCMVACESPFKAEDASYSRFRAAMIQDFKRQVETYSVETRLVDQSLASASATLPGAYAPWWGQQAGAQIFPGVTAHSDSLRNLYRRAIENSSQIQVFGDIPLIREQGIKEAEGRFTPRFFAEGRYGRSEEPVGSTLQTGGPSELREETADAEVGIRAILETGAEVSLAQRLSYLDNNSVFLQPDPQNKAELVLSVAQPLLRGGGVEYNRSLVKIAEIDSHVAMAEFVRQTEQHLLEITRAYWNLYLVRSLYLQKKQFADTTSGMVGKLQDRENLDASQSQLIRARAALAARRSELSRAEMAVQNAEDRIRALVNDPAIAASNIELIPMDAPATVAPQVDLKEAAAVALASRPEITQALLQYRAALVRLGMAQNEVQPQLDLILEGSLHGLEAGDDIEGSIDDQGDRHPSWSAGLRFETAIGEDEYDARLTRRQIEARQQANQVRTTIETVLLEVRISAREVVTAYREMAARYEALDAAKQDVGVLQDRWDQGALGDDVAFNLMNLLLESQDRLATAEQEFERSRITYNVALANLERVKGTMLRFEGLEVRRGKRDVEDLPVLEVKPVQQPADNS